MLFAIAFIGLVLGLLGLSVNLLTSRDSRLTDTLNTISLAFCIASLIIVTAYMGTRL